AADRLSRPGTRRRHAGDDLAGGAHIFEDGTCFAHAAKNGGIGFGAIFIFHPHSVPLKNELRID
ncbi:hypothetical protein DBT53_005950, partial [Aerococcus mictus]|uniref:hypothetical protein n=1 Tax=Aerococcus mictus TaxID=2976810 RepID=UPI002FD253F9